MGKVLGKDEATKRLEAHWSSFITEGDFADIASKGLNFVRIPIGYWAITPLDGDPYSQGAYEYLGQALDWAEGAGLKVMIDLHGAPGSQNGLDNSGQRGDVRWGQGDTVAQTLRALARLRDDHANHPAVAVIELLNEPMGPKLDMNMVRQFMADGVASLAAANVAIAFHDAFQGPGAWNGWSSGPAEKLLLDTHHYEVFNAGQLMMSPDEHVGAACGFGAELASSNKMAINGEWTGAMTDCVSRRGLIPDPQITPPPLSLTSLSLSLSHCYASRTLCPHPGRRLTRASLGLLAQRPWRRRALGRHLQLRGPRLVVHRLVRGPQALGHGGPDPGRRPHQPAALHQRPDGRLRKGRRLDLLDLEDRGGPRVGLPRPGQRRHHQGPGRSCW